MVKWSYYLFPTIVSASAPMALLIEWYLNVGKSLSLSKYFWIGYWLASVWHLLAPVLCLNWERRFHRLLEVLEDDPVSAWPITAIGAALKLANRSYVPFTVLFFVVFGGMLLGSQDYLSEQLGIASPERMAASAVVLSSIAISGGVGLLFIARMFLVTWTLTTRPIQWRPFDTAQAFSTEALGSFCFTSGIFFGLAAINVPLLLQLPPDQPLWLVISEAVSLGILLLGGIGTFLLPTLWIDGMMRRFRSEGLREIRSLVEQAFTYGQHRLKMYAAPKPGEEVLAARNRLELALSLRRSILEANPMPNAQVTLGRVVSMLVAPFASIVLLLLRQ